MRNHWRFGFTSCVVAAIAITPAGAQAPRAPRCAPIPSRDYTIYRHIYQSSPCDRERGDCVHHDSVGYGTSAFVDLDGDGVSEVFVPQPAAGDCVETMHRAIYTSRDGCAVLLGVIQGAFDREAIASAPRNHGMPNLVTGWQEGRQDDPREPAVMRVHSASYVFDGHRYVEQTRTFRDSICHHCATQHCNVELLPPT